MTGIFQDFRYAIRGLVKNPGFTTVAVLTLALGIGANTAIVSMYREALVRALPVPQPEELVNLSSPGPRPGRTSRSGTARASDVFSYPLFQDIARGQTIFTGTAAHRDFPVSLAHRGQAWFGDGRLVSGSYFQVLGLRPAAGRLFGPDDDQTPGAHDVVILSHRLWTTKFNADPRVIDDTLVVNGRGMIIVGVAPSDFVSTTLEGAPDTYVPLTMAGFMLPGWNGFEDRRDHWVYVFARLKPKYSREAAQQAVNGLFSKIVADIEFPVQRSGMGTEAREQFLRRQLILEPGAQGQRPEREELRDVFTLLFCVTGVVLLIACANVANLLLTRGAYRETEMTVRLSLGAGRWRLVRQLLIESMLLASMGTVAGLVVTSWTLSAIRVAVGQAFQYFRFQLDVQMLAYAAGLSVFTVVLVGLYPALYTTRRDLISALRGSTSLAGTRAAERFRMSLTTSQIALSLALLVVAGLFIKSLENVARVDLGIRPENVLTFRLRPQLSGYTPERTHALADRVEEDLRNLPGVEAVSASTILLLTGHGESSNVTVDGFSDPSGGMSSAKVGPGYFEAVGIPLLAGRAFTPADRLSAPKVAIVNQSFAKQFNLGQNPVGTRMGLGAGRGTKLDIEIVGLVQDARYSQLKAPPPPQYYLPYRQEHVEAFNFYIRSSGPTETLMPLIPATVSRIDAMLPIEGLAPMTTQLTATVQPERFMRALSLASAALATLLTAIGLYGVLSFAVVRRTKEIGLRIALGAKTGDVQRLILGRAGWMTAIGLVLGLFAALALGRVAQSMLFGVESSEPLIVLGAAIAIAMIVAVGAALPARRAARVDPLVALRYE